MKWILDMTSVLYNAGLNYQAGNPVRQEMVTMKREIDSIRKSLELVTEENLIYRKYLMKLLEPVENGQVELQSDLRSLSEVKPAVRPAGLGTVQGGGFRR